MFGSGRVPGPRPQAPAPCTPGSQAPAPCTLGFPGPCPLSPGLPWDVSCIIHLHCGSPSVMRSSPPGPYQAPQIAPDWGLAGTQPCPGWLGPLPAPRGSCAVPAFGFCCQPHLTVPHATLRGYFHFCSRACPLSTRKPPRSCPYPVSPCCFLSSHLARGVGPCSLATPQLVCMFQLHKGPGSPPGSPTVCTALARGPCRAIGTVRVFLCFSCPSAWAPRPAASPASGLRPVRDAGGRTGLLLVQPALHSGWCTGSLEEVTSGANLEKERRVGQELGE